MEQSCPVGDDPLTKNQVNELQLMQCTARDGKFLLYFDGYPSKWIPFTANAAAVKTALESIPVLNSITVTFSQPDSPVCSPFSNIVQIQFNLNFGPLPPLVPLLDSVMIEFGGKIDISGFILTLYLSYKKINVLNSYPFLQLMV